jgi:hypothetical protein
MIVRLTKGLTLIPILRPGHSAPSGLAFRNFIAAIYAGNDGMRQLAS